MVDGITLVVSRARLSHGESLVNFASRDRVAQSAVGALYKVWTIIRSVGSKMLRKVTSVRIHIWP